MTLRSVAQAAGVSVATASQALRNHSGTAPATCARVQEVARELGYRPDPVLASLGARRFGRSEKLEASPVVLVTNSIWTRRLRAIRYEDALKGRLLSLGYAFRRELIESPEELASGLRRWYHQGVRGLVFGNFSRPDWLRAADLSDFSCVFLGGLCDPPYLHSVKADAAAATEMALRRLIEEVPGRIGVFLHRHTPVIQDDLLREGMARTILATLPPRRRVPLAFSEFNTDVYEQIEQVRAWQQRSPCDGVTGFTIVAHLLQEAGWHRPGRTFVGLMSNDPQAYDCVTEPEEPEAERAVELLAAMIRYGEKGVPRDPLQVLVPPLWTAGGGEGATASRG